MLWQKAMAQVFQGIQCVVAFIDDIWVTGRARKEQIRNVLHHLCQASLHLRKDKYLKSLAHVTLKDTDTMRSQWPIDLL